MPEEPLITPTPVDVSEPITPTPVDVPESKGLTPEEIKAIVNAELTERERLERERNKSVAEPKKRKSLVDLLNGR